MINLQKKTVLKLDKNKKFRNFPFMGPFISLQPPPPSKSDEK
jgi:hypothetical protein